MSTAPGARWSTEHIRDVVQAKFGKRPCLFQIKIARAIREKQNDVIAVAATGSGKTLSFWIPLLMALEDGEDKLVIVVTPLNLLGKQNVDILAAAGMEAIAVSAKNANETTFKAIEAGRYQVVVLGPEIIMQDGGHCEKLWEKPVFVAKILYMVFDEAHCITQWSGFRDGYKHLGGLRRLVGSVFPFLMPSATLSPPILRGVSDTMLLRRGRTSHILRSNDRPEIAIAVRPMRYSAASLKDLDFLVPDDFCGVKLPKFLLFHQSIKQCEAAAAYLNARLPPAHRGKIRYFHSIMTEQYREDEYALFRDGATYGLCVTDSFGMGLDLSDIELIVQWKVPANINAMWQRFGRAARGIGRLAFAILIAEKDYFDGERERKALLAEKRRQQPSRKRKRTEKQKKPPPKRQALPPPLTPDLRCVLNSPDDAANALPDHQTNLHAEIPVDERRSSRVDEAGAILEAAREVPHAQEGPDDVITLAMDEETDRGTEDANTAMDEDADHAMDEDVADAMDEDAADATAPDAADMVAEEMDTVEEQAAMMPAAGESGMSDEERRCLYNESAHAPARSARAAQKENRVIEPAMDDLINADTRGLGCRRKALTLYYSNDIRVSDHMDCDLANPNGCSRCAPKLTLVCCDLCHPAAFADIFQPTSGPTAPRKMKKSSVKPFVATAPCTALRNALFAWRDACTVIEFGQSILQDFSGNIFLPLTALNRVIDCAQASKLLSLENLKRELVWESDFFNRYGRALLDIVLIHFPLPELPEPSAVLPAPALTSQPAASSIHRTEESPADAAAPARTRKQPTCSVCRQIGHTRRSRNCPARPEASGANTVPSVAHEQPRGLNPAREENTEAEPSVPSGALHFEHYTYSS